MPPGSESDFPRPPGGRQPNRDVRVLALEVDIPARENAGHVLRLVGTAAELVVQVVVGRPRRLVSRGHPPRVVVGKTEGSHERRVVLFVPLFGNHLVIRIVIVPRDAIQAVRLLHQAARAIVQKIATVIEIVHFARGMEATFYVLSTLNK